MKKSMFLFFVSLLLFCVPLSVFSMQPVRIDVLYMNHGPLRPTLRELTKCIPIIASES